MSTKTKMFRGGPAEAQEFYEGLEADNSKTHWTTHKDVYEAVVLSPMNAPGWPRRLSNLVVRVRSDVVRR